MTIVQIKNEAFVPVDEYGQEITAREKEGPATSESGAKQPNRQHQPKNNQHLKPRFSLREVSKFIKPNVESNHFLFIKFQICKTIRLSDSKDQLTLWLVMK